MLKHTSLKAAIAVSLSVAFVVGTSGTALADTQWQQDHPRREQVTGRLANQNARIHNQVTQGNLTKGQAAALHRDDHQIRQEERLMASQNGGHITKQEQQMINQQQNQVSKAIGG